MMFEGLTVLIVHNFYQIPGGEDTVVENEKRMLEKNGCRVILYTRSNSELERMPMFRRLLLPFVTVFNFQTYKDINRIIIEERIDIVHVHNTLCLVSPAVYYAAKKCGTPVVQTLHNFRMQCPGALFYRDGHICEDCIKQGLQCAIRHKCYKKSVGLSFAVAANLYVHRKLGIYGDLFYICLTEFNKEKLLQINQVKRENVYVKPNFVENGNTETQAKSGFVYVGRIEEIKGVRELLCAWRMANPLGKTLSVCGDGPLLDECKKYARKHNLKNVEFLGYVDHIAAKRIIGKNEFLVSPTKVYEGLPMTIIEAFSEHTPVIVPNMGNAGSIVQHGFSGYKYEPGSVEELANCMATASCYDELGGNAFMEYEEKYSEDANASMLHSIYMNVLKKSERLKNEKHKKKESKGKRP